MATYREHEDLIQIGAYAAGSNEHVDRAIRLDGPLRRFLKQDRAESTGFDTTVQQLAQLAKSAGAAA